MRFHILFVRNQELMEKDVFVPEESFPEEYFSDLYSDLISRCRDIGIQIICIVPIAGDKPLTTCYISSSFRYFMNFDIYKWLKKEFPSEEIVFKGDKFSRFSKRRRRKEGRKEGRKGDGE